MAEQTKKPFAGALNDPTKERLEYQSSLQRSANLLTIYWSVSIENIYDIDALDGQWWA